MCAAAGLAACGGFRLGAGRLALLRSAASAGSDLRRLALLVLLVLLVVVEQLLAMRRPKQPIEQFVLLPKAQPLLVRLDRLRRDGVAAHRRVASASLAAAAHAGLAPLASGCRARAGALARGGRLACLESHRLVSCGRHPGVRE